MKKRIKRKEEDTEPKQMEKSEEMAEQSIGHNDVEANTPAASNKDGNGKKKKKRRKEM